MATTELAAWFNRMMLIKGRRARGRTQREVADEVLLSVDSYRAYEAGRTTPPAKHVKALAAACGIGAEIAAYMAQVASKKDEALEADQRFNALFIALAEEHYGSFFKFDALMIPGILQLQEYHYIVARLAEPASDQWVDNGWDFKEGRQRVIESRTDRPEIHFLIGETALLQLWQVSEELYQDQMTHLRRYARRPGVKIRILPGPVLAQRSSFEIYSKDGGRLAGPMFVYTEGLDSSWLIDDPTRIASYDVVRKMLWKKAIRIEVYHDDDRRCRLA
jgi:transcriptional regulator with XRE-family HTH domain